uniref:Uncharacterized protein n=1 Tax=Oryza sativa subsp. japonica TaxID=39947 RepID=Q6K1Y9_ORYSJ|nr:hypothetical protein [Oryza sativa Japonica Group]
MAATAVQQQQHARRGRWSGGVLAFVFSNGGNGKPSHVNFGAPTAHSIYYHDDLV